MELKPNVRFINYGDYMHNERKIVHVDNSE